MAAITVNQNSPPSSWRSLGNINYTSTPNLKVTTFLGAVQYVKF